MPSSADVSIALATVADAVIAAVVGVDAPTILIDGRSGAGKSTLARDLTARLGDDAQLVGLDSFYPGWDGLAAGADAAREGILVPRARGLLGQWRRWDWVAGVPAEQHTVDSHRPLVLEGVGVLTRATAPLADVSVWLESPAAARRARALGRDGETYRPHWERWAAQEIAHLEDHRPAELATIVAQIP